MGTAFTLSVLSGVAPHSNGSSFTAEATGLGPSTPFISSVIATKPRIAVRYSRKTTYGFTARSLPFLCAAVGAAAPGPETARKAIDARRPLLAVDQAPLQARRRRAFSPTATQRR